MLRRLRNPAQAAQAVLALKQEPPTAVEFAAIIEELVKSTSHLPKSTLQWAGHQLAVTADPLVRQSVKSQLGDIPELFDGEILSMIRSKDLELALSTRRQKESNAPAIADFVADQGILPQDFSEAQWFRAFHNAVSREDYSQACKIWQKRTAFFNIPLNAAILSQFVQLIGRHQDAHTMKSVFQGLNFDLSPASPLLAAALNCIPSVPKLVQHLVEYKDYVEVSDFQHVSDTLAQNVQELTRLEVPISTALGNVILLGLYRNFTSHLVFHFYRCFLAPAEFTPDATTAQILANAAYRLGNSKLLSYQIFSEFQHLELPRKFFETMLMCQLVGTGATTAKFVLGEMIRRKISVRRHIQKIIFNKFSQGTDNIMDLALPGFQSGHTTFDVEAALKESGTPTQQSQARANTDMYMYGKEPDVDPREVLDGMLDFEKRRNLRMN